MPNLLTAEAGLKFGPVFIETFFKHYLDRHHGDRSTSDPKTGASSSSSSFADGLKGKKDLLWQEGFQIVKSFLSQAAKHTVEELQEFSNARIPAPPWIFVQRLLVPRAMCDKAANYLIKAFGGETMTSRVVGGTRWWQVRGLDGVDCQWICQKSHMQSRRRQSKQKTTQTDSANDVSGLSGDQDSIAYMDGTRCMLYAHGGGYYFGSVDQQRYCLQRYARKINGRVLAVNYRLAPQYPFPCGLQDLLAAYLYLIDPPPGAHHTPIPPESIIVAGDSAGGGLCLALLQIIRDTGLPPPSGAVLISPWCDLTHSFPSIVENTASDIIPPYGLCFHKPSVLWPPPAVSITTEVRSEVRETFQTVAGHVTLANKVVTQWRDKTTVGGSSSVSVDRAEGHAGETSTAPSSGSDHLLDLHSVDAKDAITGEVLPMNIAGKLPLPWQSEISFPVSVNGQRLSVDRQIQLYCPNNLLVHPLISPVLSYVGGLPPLFIIAGDKEVLRDEIIYLAHKAAHPDKYSIHEDSKKLYPPIRSPAMSPTFVHLQVYDESCHVLPLFSFTTPAKFCYRAIAEFSKHFAKGDDDLPMVPQTPISPNSSMSTSSSGVAPQASASTSSSTSTSSTTMKPRRYRSLLSLISIGHKKPADISSQVGLELFTQTTKSGTAGDPFFYSKNQEKLVSGNIIRERVSVRGVTRPINSEELTVLDFPADHIGIINEAAAQRFLLGQSKWDKRFGSMTEKINAQRKRNMILAKSEITKTLDQFQERLLQDSSHHERDLSDDSNTWSWSWAVSGENPPASSIVARRDTTEARRLARIADQSVAQEESKLSGNKLWNILANFLTYHFGDDKDTENNTEHRK